MKKVLEKIKKYCKTEEKPARKKELEKKVVEGAKKALKEYGRVFERLAEHDRT
ncbi:hypothetical protein HY227_00265 [Candidatus Wolfebacteria bacterium]|nr:hypothetical protein [Candidatus Wolfebacteria bacterium]